MTGRITFGIGVNNDDCRTSCSSEVVNRETYLDQDQHEWLRKHIVVY